jgi:tRNA A-37 threonylcarbamoyl transferase component Bud32/tetratricopeptide (TPR) repeat protein
MTCLSDTTIARLVNGDLEGAELDGADAHVDTCASCRERLARGLTKSPIPATLDARARVEIPDTLVGRILADRYLVRRRIGSGAMGTVYEAEHALIGRRVAIKVLQPQWASSPEVVRRFANEARAAGTLGHPGILSALDLGRTDDDRPFLVLEYLEGEDLEALLARGPLSIGRAVAIARAIADALSAAHAAGIVHRDLKPENVFLTNDGGLKVLDFGISKFLTTTGPGTAPGAIMGTPMYMAPEQLEDAASADARSDVYALGVMLYRMLTGALPFNATSLAGLALAIVSHRAPPIRARRPDVSEALERVIERAMSVAPADRYASMQALAAAIEPFASDESAAPAAFDRRVATVVVATDVIEVTEATRRIEEKGGRVIADGSELTGVFGEGTWHGEEPVRAVEAALALRSLAGAVAVASGHVVVLDQIASGSPIDRARDACKEALRGVAIVGSIARLGSRFVIETRGDDLAEIKSAAPSSVAPAADLAPLIGRDTERAQIELAIARARSDSAPVVCWITGEPGAGKSRLAAEVIAASDMTVLAGRGAARGGQRLGALADAVLGFAREHDAGIDAPELDARREAVRRLANAAAIDDATFLGELLGVSMPGTTGLSAARGDPRLMRDRLTLVVRAFIDGLARRGPLAIVLEDLQWVDAESLELIDRMLGEALYDRAVLILGTARPELFSARAPFDAADAIEIKLRGLGLADVRALAGVLGWFPIAEPLARALCDRTGGNPLFVEQIVRAMQRGASPTELPIDVEAAAQARLDALDAPRRAVMERVAVLACPASAGELEQLGAERADRTIAALVREGLIKRRSGPDAPRYDARTPLVTEVLYAQLAGEKKRALHLACAAMLGRRAEADREMLGLHFDRGGAPSEAAREYQRATLEAARHGDAARVLRCAQRALELGADAVAQLHLACADVLAHEGKLDAQGAHLEAAERAASTPEERARVDVAIAVRTLRREGPAASLSLFERAVERATQAGESVVLARALGAHATALVYVGRLDEAAGVLGEAERIVSTRAPALSAELASWRAQLAAARGDLGARRAAYLAALELYEELGDERSKAAVSVNLGDVLNRFGAYAEAEATLSAAHGRCRRLGISTMEGYALVNLAYARAMMGRTDAASADLERAEQIATASGDAHLSVWIAIYGARVAHAEERWDDAIARAAECAVRADRLGLGGAFVAANVIAAQGYTASGDAEAAYRAIKAADERTEELGGIEEDEAELHDVHARALAALGRDAEARAVRERGQKKLESTARRIADPEWRRRFLEDVASHRALRG